ncbi:kinase-like protein [Gigaspora margarita]|uniref:Kinase-like protein n=1 Tax=Gigaspora margarita TaxID=4874 RepID=A0A8H4A7R3_GIGMA|nr:kinase-like protein [Gigaspora margarita]
MAKFYDFESVNYDESNEDEYKLYNGDQYDIPDVDQEEFIAEEWIEKAILDGHINYLEYNKFTNPIMIGIGGFGKVFKYEWRENELTVALKCLKVDTSINERIVEDFVNELKLLLSVSNHQNVIYSME